MMKQSRMRSLRQEKPTEDIK